MDQFTVSSKSRLHRLDKSLYFSAEPRVEKLFAVDNSNDFKKQINGISNVNDISATNNDNSGRSNIQSLPKDSHQNTNMEGKTKNIAFLFVHNTLVTG